MFHSYVTNYQRVNTGESLKKVNICQQAIHSMTIQRNGQVGSWSWDEQDIGKTKTPKQQWMKHLSYPLMNKNIIYEQTSKNRCFGCSNFPIIFPYAKLAVSAAKEL